MNYISEIIEYTAVITALIYVFLATKAKRICFLFGLISSVLFVYICAVDALYFDTFINSYYVVMSFVGWYSWKSETEEIKIRRFNAKSLFILISISLAVSLALGFAFDRYTDASLAYIDSFTTVFAILATWMMVERYLENWVIWIVADAVAVYLYLVKGHMPIAFLFFIYTLIAVKGHFNWKRLAHVIK